MTIIERRKTSV